VIKNIVFDIGEVLLSFRPRDYLQEKYGPGEKTDRLEGIIFQGKYWEQLDRGIITSEEAKSQLKKEFTQYSKEIEDILEDWPQILKPLPASDLIKPIKQKGFILFFLSNFHIRAWQIVREKFDFFSVFQGGVISAEEGLLKPEEEIYLKLLDTFSLKAEESLFIDDRPENIEAAEKIGFSTHRYLEIKGLKKELQKKDIL